MPPTSCPVPAKRLRPVSFRYLSMCWNAANVEPFAFSNTMTVKDDHPVEQILAWTAVVARGAPGGRLQALVINCHGGYVRDRAGSLDSAGGIPGPITPGHGLHIGTGIHSENATAFAKLAGLVGEIHIYACGAASRPFDPYSSPLSPSREKADLSIARLIANASGTTVVASRGFQPDVEGPGLNMAPAMVGEVIRFAPGSGR